MKFPILQTLIASVAISLVACSGGASEGSSATSGGGSTPTVKLQKTIAFANAGEIPVFDNGQTTTVVYVHNLSNKPVSGIVYSAQSNVHFSDGRNNQVLDQASSKLCASIPANGECPLKITVNLAKEMQSGAALISASYNDPFTNQVDKSSLIANFAWVNDNTASGVKFKGGTEIANYGAPYGYATVYAYGTGDNAIYTIAKIKPDRAGVEIVNGDISGRQLQSKAIQAIEFKVPAFDKTLGVNISLTTGLLQSSTTRVKSKSMSLKDEGGTSSTVSLAMTPINGSFPVLIGGNIPAIDTESNPNGGKWYISNVGNAQSASFTVSSDNEALSVLNNGDCSSITVGQACEISFSPATSSGTATLSFSYSIAGTPVTVTQPVVWFNRKGGAQVSLSLSNNPVVFDDVDPNGGNTEITVTNTGGYNLIINTNDTKVSKAPGASATPKLVTPDSNSCGASLSRGASCKYKVKITGPAEANRQVNFHFVATYNGSKTLTRTLPIKYTSTQNFAALALALDNVPAIKGNGTQESIVYVKVTNSGNLEATLSAVPQLTWTDGSIGSEGFVTNYIHPSQTEGTNPLCQVGTPIPAGQTCDFAYKFGPATSVSGESAEIEIKLNYNYIGASGQPFAATNATFTILPNNANINLAISPIGTHSGGNGTSEGQSVIFSGASTTDTGFELSYTNNGDNPVTILGINNPNPIWAWNMTTSCNSSLVLQPGGHCAITYLSQLSQYSGLVDAANGSTTTMNLNLPTVIVRDNAINTIYAVDDIGNQSMIYVKTHQAVLTAEYGLAESNTWDNYQFELRYTLTNAEGYQPITVNATLPYIFGNDVFGKPFVASKTTGCGDPGVEVSGNFTQACTLTPGGVSGVDEQDIIYNVNTSLFDSGSQNFDVLFTYGKQSQAVSTPQAMYVTMPAPTDPYPSLLQN